EAGVPVVLSPAPFDASQSDLVELANILVPNEVEAALLEPGVSTAAAQAARLLKRGPSTVIVTLGEKGALAATGAGIETVGAYPVRPVDSVGAGEAFCGALAVALAEGLPLTEAVRFACAAGAVSVTRAGAAASLPSRDEVEQLLRKGREGNLSG